MLARISSQHSQEDPFAAALRPPEEETEHERKSRLLLESEAVRISEQIDEELRLERERLRKAKDDVKLLLLGQAESGKSTLLKQFQLMYKPNSLDDERLSWRTVVFFNVIHSLKYILNTLEAWDDTFDDKSDQADSPSRSSESGSLSPLRSAATDLSAVGTSRRTSPDTDQGSRDPLIYQIANLRRRLSPLVACDSQLADRLTDGITVSGSGKGGVYVRTGWQARSIESGLSRRRPVKSPGKQVGDAKQREDPLLHDVGNMLDACKGDIKDLWQHPTVKALQSRRKLKLDEWSEFFLRNIDRIASPNYSPTTDDILHARIQTMGVTEHVFDVNIHGKATTWHIYDVGGARGQRHSWIPYFDDCNAIIFVAPISSFDQYLEEDPRTNRINDSLQLFTQICSNPLLKHAHLVLFLNKTDILQAKLAAGLQVSKYITSYGTRQNEFDSVVQYFRAHFQNAHTKNNETRRALYTHLTSAVNTKTTHRIIGNVRDSIFRGHLQSAALV